MNNIVAEELKQGNMNEFDLNIFIAFAKIRSDGKRPLSESIFKYLKSINKYGNVTLNFTNNCSLTLIDDEIIITRG